MEATLAVKLWSRLHSRWYGYEQRGWLHGQWNVAGPGGGLVESTYLPLPVTTSECISVGFTAAACNIAELLMGHGCLAVKAQIAQV